MDNRHIVLILSLVASACLVTAFYYPFMCSEFNLEFSTWMPNFLDAKTQVLIIFFCGGNYFIRSFVSNVIA